MKVRKKFPSKVACVHCNGGCRANQSPEGYDLCLYGCTGCGACMESLLRTRVGEFALADAIKLSEVEAYVIAHRSDAAETEEMQLPFLQAVDTVFLKYESVTVDGQFRKYLYNGNRLRPEMFLEEYESMRMAPVRVYDDEGAFFGIYEYQAEKEDYKPLKVFK